jgi:hypothetical protein
VPASTSSSSAVVSHGLTLGRAPQLGTRDFVGRDAELEKLELLLVPKPVRNVVALVGAGGLGKTQLAITFAQRFHQQYSSVFWLNAKDETSLKQDLAELADTVLDSDQGANSNSADQGEIIQRVNKWFSRSDNTQWLLILDNYDDPKFPGLSSPTGYDIRKYFPRRNQGSILITTRSQRLDFAGQLRLGIFTDLQESIEILSARAGYDLTGGEWSLPVDEYY